MTRKRALALAAGCLAGVAYVSAVDPHDPNAFMPRCPTKLLTGFDCPACGGLRLAHDLLHLNLRDALHDNPFLLVAGPLVATAVWKRWREHRDIRVVPVSDGFAVCLGAAALTWMVVRNTPAWPLKPIVSG